MEPTSKACGKTITTRKRKIYERRDSTSSQNLICKLLIIAISPSWKACFNEIQHAANIFFAIKTNKRSKIYEKNKNTGVPWIDFLSTCELRKKKANKFKVKYLH